MIADHQLRRCLLLGLLLATAACAPADNSGPRDRATITVLYPGDERILGPFWEMPAKFLVFMPLARIDEGGEMIGALAREWGHSPDFRTWTVRLRTDVRWHDGAPFTARDVAFTWRLFGHPDVAWEPPGFRTVDVLDDSTVKVTFSRATAEPISTWEVFYPEHLLDALPPSEFLQWDFWKNPIGNGPYRYVRHVPKTMTQLAANDDYFFGRPAVDTLVLKFADGPVSGLPELMSGNVDVLGWAGRTETLRFRDDPAYRVTYNVNTATRGIMWKASRPYFEDPRVRRALTLAIDRRELHAFLGFPENLPLPDGPTSDAQIRSRAFPTPLPHDAAEARLLLDGAGWRDTDGDGVRDRDGQPFRFTLLVPSELDQAGVYVQDQLGRVGVRADVSTVDLNVVRQRSSGGDFDAVMVILNRFRDERFFGPDGASGYRNSLVDEILRRVPNEFDSLVRDSLYAQMYSIFRDDQPATVLFPLVTQFVVPNWIEGLSSPFRADPLANAEFLRIVR